MKEAKLAINDIKEKYGFEGEMKWSGINRRTVQYYRFLNRYSVVLS